MEVKRRRRYTEREIERVKKMVYSRKKGSTSSEVDGEGGEALILLVESAKKGKRVTTPGPSG